MTSVYNAYTTLLCQLYKIMINLLFLFTCLICLIGFSLPLFIPIDLEYITLFNCVLTVLNLSQFILSYICYSGNASEQSFIKIHDALLVPN